MEREFGADPALVPTASSQQVVSTKGFDPGELISVPLDAPEPMWDGLPRAIMLWLGFKRPTPRSLFQHLKCSGYTIPAWMHEEGELGALDHVPSKGTRCVLIYRAMVENWREALARIEARQGGDVQQAPREAREPETAPETITQSRKQGDER